MANIEKRQLRREMSRGVGKDEEFWVWANTYFVPAPQDYLGEFSPELENLGYFNCYILREKVFIDFKESLPKTTAGKYKTAQFKKALKAFCDYHDYDLNPVERCNGDANIKSRRITKSIDGRTTEVFFISTGLVNESTGIANESESATESLPFPEEELQF
jgi:hypothetical protein